MIIAMLVIISATTAYALPARALPRDIVDSISKRPIGKISTTAGKGADYIAGNTVRVMSQV